MLVLFNFVLSVIFMMVSLYYVSVNDAAHVAYYVGLSIINFISMSISMICNRLDKKK